MTSIPFRLPIKANGSERWAQLSVLASAHTILGETFKEKNGNYSHFGGHRVRAYTVKGNVHWLLPDTVQELDISQVRPISAPRRQGS